MTRFNRLAHALTGFAGSGRAVLLTLALVLAWGVWGLVAGPSRTWELAVTCGVPIFTLLMVFVLQHALNREARATSVKLNELLLTLEQPRNEILDAESLPDHELSELTEEYQRHKSASE